ncbi:putative peptidoglycan lipid II flippase [Streptomyces canus]|uniref:murein biosynthesis integral membrane protein MurJ n=1 Tax=Streptomyces canus TaxID=58343 RepID=UPI002781A3E9|nr:lipid II flippase MurJ [Streptomyces canus]MDQ0601629.1 putative peptidoglycan lipid II flippase [Streptomyces canus]
MTVTPPRTARAPDRGTDGTAVPAARAAAQAVDSTEMTAVTRKFLAKATLITASLSVAGALLGLVRDQTLARLFGAGSETDAFLVAWTVPEFASTLLIEDGLAIALIPAFSFALVRRAQGASGDPVRSLVANTLPRLSLGFVAVSALVIGAAPYLVEALAPGLPDPRLATDCTRLTATCVLSFGLAGYCSAALRAHRRYLAPATIYVAYNVGIIATMFLLGGRWGVRSAAAGVAVGGCLMVAAQLPSLWRHLRSHPSAAGGAGAETPPKNLALISAVLLFALCRQSQILIERFLASSLPSGAISHLNYAQKVAQIPMTLSLMLCTVTFPVVAQALADGDTERARARVERDLMLASCLVLVGAATVVACAPQIIAILFQRGAFTAQDTVVTAGVMRVYALGLLGQTLVGVLIRSYFSAGRPTWYPTGAMAAGVGATFWIGKATVNSWGVSGIAAANAVGITITAALLLLGPSGKQKGGAAVGATVTAALLLLGPPRRPKGRAGGRSLREARPEGPGTVAVPAAPMAPHGRAVQYGSSRGVPIRTRQVLSELSRPVLAAGAATAAGAFTASGPQSQVVGLAVGCVTVAAVFLVLGPAVGAQGCTFAFRSVRTVTRRLRHGRSS